MARSVGTRSTWTDTRRRRSARNNDLARIRSGRSRAYCVTRRLLSELASAFVLSLYWVLRLVREEQAKAVSGRVSRVVAAAYHGARLKRYDILFGALSPTERADLDSAHVAYLARLMVHSSRLETDTLDSLCDKVLMEGQEHIEAARAHNRGVLIVAAHAGTWMHAPVTLAARGQPPLAVINPELRIFGRYLRQSIANRFRIPVANAGEDAYDAAKKQFRSNRLMFVTIDMTVRPAQSAWLRFGRAELLVDVGPAVIALRQRVPVIWASTFHDEPGRSRVAFSPPMTVGAGTRWARPDQLMQHWLDLLWADVRARPAQWWPLVFVPLRRPSSAATVTVPVAATRQ